MKFYKNFISSIDTTVLNATNFGASGSIQTTIGSINAGSNVLTLADPVDFKNGQGISIANAGSLPTISIPSSLTITPIGTTGSTSYTYGVAALDANGGITAVITASTSIGNANLSTQNYNALSVSPVINAIGYIWYRIATSGIPNTIGYIGETASTTLNDTGIAVANTSTSTISAPISLTITPTGITGSTSYTYGVAAIDSSYNMTTVITGMTSIGNNVLSTSNYNALSCPSVAGAIGYIWFRKSNFGNPNTIGYIAETLDPFLNDTGLSTNIQILSIPANVPKYAPSAPVGGYLYSIISSGAGTTRLILTNTASTTVNNTIINHDDTVAIQNALNSLPSNGGTVVINPGIYYCRTITIKHGQRLVGRSTTNNHYMCYGTILRQPDNANVPYGLITTDNNTTSVGIGISNLCLDGNGIYNVYSYPQSSCNNVRGTGFYQRAGKAMETSSFSDLTITQFPTNGMVIEDAWGNYFCNLNISYNGGAQIYLTCLDSWSSTQANTFIQVEINVNNGDKIINPTGKGVVCDGTNYTVVKNNFIGFNIESPRPALIILGTNCRRNSFSQVGIVCYGSSNPISNHYIDIINGALYNSLNQITFVNIAYAGIYIDSTSHFNIMQNINFTSSAGSGYYLIEIHGSDTVLQNVTFYASPNADRSLIVVYASGNIIENIAGAVSTAIACVEVDWSPIIVNNINITSNISSTIGCKINSNARDCQVSNVTMQNSATNPISDSGVRTIINGVGSNGVNDPSVGGNWNGRGILNTPILWNDGSTNYMSIWNGTSWIKFTAS